MIPYTVNAVDDESTREISDEDGIIRLNGVKKESVIL